MRQVRQHNGTGGCRSSTKVHALVNNALGARRPPSHCASHCDLWPAVVCSGLRFQWGSRRRQALGPKDSVGFSYRHRSHLRLLCTRGGGHEVFDGGVHLLRHLVVWAVASIYTDLLGVCNRSLQSICPFRRAVQRVKYSLNDEHGALVERVEHVRQGPGRWQIEAALQHLHRPPAGSIPIPYRT